MDDAAKLRAEIRSLRNVINTLLDRLDRLDKLETTKEPVSQDPRTILQVAAVISERDQPMMLDKAGNRSIFDDVDAPHDSELCPVCGKPLPHHPDHFLP